MPAGPLSAVSTIVLNLQNIQNWFNFFYSVCCQMSDWAQNERRFLLRLCDPEATSTTSTKGILQVPTCSSRGLEISTVAEKWIRREEGSCPIIDFQTPGAGGAVDISTALGEWLFQSACWSILVAIYWTPSCPWYNHQRVSVWKC